MSGEFDLSFLTADLPITFEQAQAATVKAMAKLEEGRLVQALLGGSRLGPLVVALYEASSVETSLNPKYLALDRQVNSAASAPTSEEPEVVLESTPPVNVLAAAQLLSAAAVAEIEAFRVQLAKELGARATR